MVSFFGETQLRLSTFRKQKKSVRMMLKLSNSVSCISVIKQCKIVTPPSSYMYPVIMYVVTHKYLFTSSNMIHSHNTVQYTNIYVIPPKYANVR